jgi:hypothetical protein
MILILRYPNGRRADALLLMRGERVMRVALHGCNDTHEIRFVSGCWLDEGGERVSIEAIVAEPHQGGRQTNTKYTTTAEIPKTATAAMSSSATARMD